jgi:nickel/cobalt exporter
MRLAVVTVLATLVASAHPMGNFSVNQYTLIRPGADRVEVTYVIDLAEAPAFDLFHEWKVEPDSAAARDRASDRMRAWIGGLRFTSANQAVAPHIARIEAAVASGSSGLATLRVTAQVSLLPPGTTLDFEDRNFEDRSGWKEIVIEAGPGASILRASHSGQDRSHRLTAYPSDGSNPPFDLRAHVEWTTGPALGRAPVIEQIAQPQAARSGSASKATAAVPNDFLSRLLGRRDLTLAMIVAGLAVAFGLGAMHAMSPGHGKTIVAAYLVGSRGTFGHAMLLGGTVTFTHTISVFLLGLATLFLSRYIVPDRVFPVLGTISGLAIVVIGVLLLLKRARQIREHHHHHHDHAHPHEPGHHHHDDGHTHHHHVEGDVTVSGLIALGASGGLVPCPSALVLLLSAVALGRTGLGLVLLIAFSLGLATVLIAIGALVLYAKHWLPDANRTAEHPAFRYIPLLSAGIIVCVGLVMTGVSVAQAFSPVFN